jgi:hypothetical protein
MPTYTNGYGYVTQPQDDTYVDPKLPLPGSGVPNGDPSHYPGGDIFGPGSAYNPDTYTGRKGEDSGLPYGPIRSGPVRIPGSPGYGETPTDQPTKKKTTKKSTRSSSSSRSSSSGAKNSSSSKSGTSTTPTENAGSQGTGLDQPDDAGANYTGLIIAAIVVGAGIALYANSERKKRRATRRGR